MKHPVYKEKMGAVERRAFEFMQDRAENCRDGDAVKIAVKWRRSRDWGSNPHIYNYHGQDMVSVSGCGYCKLSTALADLLCFAFADEEEAFRKIHLTGGAGEGSVINAVAECGGKLTKLYSDSDTDLYDFVFPPKKK